MRTSQSGTPPPGLNLDDIYHVLFRHKWKILIVWALGAIMALAIWLTTPVMYKSDAKILIRYIVENKNLNPNTANSGDSNVKNTDPNGEGIINSEQEILTSFDLALDVVDGVGAAKILEKAGGGSDRNQAAAIIQNGLSVDPLRRSAVIQISFRSADQTIVQPVLDQLIVSYRKKHFETHQAVGSLDDFLVQQADQYRTQLAQTELELREAKAKAGVSSLEQTKKDQAENLARIQRQLYDAQAELVGRKATLGESNQVSATTETNAPPHNPAPPEVVENYKRVCSLIASLEKQQEQLETSFTQDSPFIKGIHENIVKNKKTKALLETSHPDLKDTPVADGSPDNKKLLSSLDEIAIKSLQAKIDLHTQKLAELQKQIAAVNDMEGTILELQRKRDLCEQNYQYFNSRLERAHIDEAVGPGRSSNIQPIQKPTPSYRDLGKVSKKLFMLLAATFGCGIALAFALEFYFDRSFKRPIEIETRLTIPLFMSIPKTRSNGKGILALPHVPKLLAGGDGSGKGDNSMEVLRKENGEVAPWKSDAELRPFIAALRDRLIMSFELRNLTHNPKLVAVTSCHDGSGVSTIASGLAASLSETGEGNVLLVDMNNMGEGAAHYFRKGKLECGLDEALEMEKRSNAMVQENLYVVSENAANEMLPRVLHKRFSSLLPRLKASDYDYIIFDMPPVNQISPTPKLARFMDMVFMVVEAEKTGRDTVERATALLEESKAHVGIVLNKSKNYVPKLLQHPA